MVISAATVLTLSLAVYLGYSIY